MANAVSRRGFLRRATLCDDGNSLRPPGAERETFLDLCRDCDLCVQVCLEGILTRDAAARPLLDPMRGACTFCGDCADACPTGALIPEQVSHWPWIAQVDRSCLSANGISCRTCQDMCDASAIRFQLQTGGRSVAIVDDTACTGCGGCISGCPVTAIQLEKRIDTSREDAA